MVPNGTATSSNLSAAAAAECFPIVSAAYGPRGRTPPTLFHFCSRHAQRPFTNPLLSPQRQTSFHTIFYIPHPPFLTQARLYLHSHVISIIANTATSSACIYGLTNTHATSRRRILAGLFRVLFLFVTNFWGLWHEHDAPCAGIGCG